MARSSRISGFYKLPLDERLKAVKEWANLSGEEVSLLSNFGNLERKIADSMIENVIGAMSYPFAVAVNFRINGKDNLVPMVIEESSVVAASNAAKMLREGDGIIAKSGPQYMIGQVHLVKVSSPRYAAFKILERKGEILELANQQDPVLVRLGGRARILK